MCCQCQWTIPSEMDYPIRNEEARGARGKLLVLLIMCLRHHYHERNADSAPGGSVPTLCNMFILLVLTTQQESQLSAVGDAIPAHVDLESKLPTAPPRIPSGQLFQDAERCCRRLMVCPVPYLPSGAIGWPLWGYLWNSVVFVVARGVHEEITTTIGQEKQHMNHDD